MLLTYNENGKEVYFFGKLNKKFNWDGYNNTPNAANIEKIKTSTSIASLKFSFLFSSLFSLVVSLGDINDSTKPGANSRLEKIENTLKILAINVDFYSKSQIFFLVFFLVFFSRIVNGR